MITVDGSRAEDVQVSNSDNGIVVARVVGAPKMLIRNSVEPFVCSEGGDFEVALAR